MKVLAFVFLATGLAGPGLAQDQTNAPKANAPQTDPRTATADAFVRQLVRYMGNPDPRIRHGVRQALRSMGPQAVAAIHEARAVEKDRHVIAFMSRTITLIKLTSGGPKKGGAKEPFWDIDHVAMVANLDWTQMEKTTPILVKAHKASRELVAAFKEAGGDFRDSEAAGDLREEMRVVAEEAEASLKTFVKPEQLAKLRRYFDPWSLTKKKEAVGR